MKRQQIPNGRQMNNEKPNSGFTSAVSVLYGDVDSTQSTTTQQQQYSKTWRAFFERLNEEENVPLPFGEKNAPKSPFQLTNPLFGESSAADECEENDIPGHSFSATFDQRINASADYAENSNPNRDLVTQDEEVSSITQDNNLYGLFTKKTIPPNNVTSGPVSQAETGTPANEPVMIYSPPSFSSSFSSVGRSISRPLNSTTAGNKQRLFAEPYSLSTRQPEKRRRPTELCPNETPSIPHIRYSSYMISGPLPENLQSRKLIIYAVLYSPSSTRKHKKWENDGFLYFDLTENFLCLTKALEKQPIARHPIPRLNISQINEEYVSGHVTSIGGYEVQIQEIYFSNLDCIVVKKEIPQIPDPVERKKLAAKKARFEDDKHFFDHKMEKFLVKTEADEHDTNSIERFNRGQPTDGNSDDEEEDEDGAMYGDVKQEVDDADDDYVLNDDADNGVQRDHTPTDEYELESEQVQI